MKKKTLIIIIVSVVLLIMLIPVKLQYKDGGTVEYKSLSYSITDYHALTDREGVFLRGKEIKLFGITVYENTYEE